VEVIVQSHNPSSNHTNQKQTVSLNYLTPQKYGQNETAVEATNIWVPGLQQTITIIESLQASRFNTNLVNKTDGKLYV
jgi:hypothetical protein